MNTDCDEYKTLIGEIKTFIAHNSVTRGQLITAVVSIILFFMGAGLTAYTTLEGRVRANEIFTHKLDTELRNKADRMEKAVNTMTSAIEKMNTLLMDIDKKVSVNEAVTKQTKNGNK